MGNYFKRYEINLGKIQTQFEKQQMKFRVDLVFLTMRSNPGGKCDYHLPIKSREILISI